MSPRWLSGPSWTSVRSRFLTMTVEEPSAVHARAVRGLVGRRATPVETNSVQPILTKGTWVPHVAGVDPMKLPVVNGGYPEAKTTI